MKLFSAGLSLLLLLFTITTPASAATASPNASLSVSKDRHYVYLSFSGLKAVAKVNYILTYDSNNTQKGFEGGFSTKKSTTRSTRRQILGTCSSGKCVFQPNPKNFSLTVTFTLRSGATTTLTRTLP
ncbi:hypothetical protein A3E17_01585 [Candidatus Amesbacteria bacterium RIFCSPHIGHO2_12_FULL_48_14]|uniref:Cohesin domain-containing protein n=1 Tax=Candidatus Amesbacteria bacterium RIFCSPHIGHO2_12_FULL_48_14 TaxID=1797257 RepID=A0A1F4ZCA3_9BACT|nr:MAG: hypothetical protein A2702_02280 [Candidatus Amesbacteria bacterium RIFCSPHIGHO2_01_FULL_48_75]OGD03437.1 MAG: hypothetical protein A3E17_01585 [Candidatus Amesbacteria bacterium RIFCSPHIGHO2_12_FULL_48_14]OGD07634.1 MAG: hypothetical protein A3B58_03395 [Candidatus Amesbacteria bacterium RIFCSPLOWO2_01_FULL_48_50]